MEMIIKEHDIINFSIKTEVGTRRYYAQEVFCKDGELIVNIDNVDVLLEEVYHIEIVGNTTNLFNENHGENC